MLLWDYHVGLLDSSSAINHVCALIGWNRYSVCIKQAKEWRNYLCPGESSFLNTSVSHFEMFWTMMIPECFWIRDIFYQTLDLRVWASSSFLGCRHFSWGWFRLMRCFRLLFLRWKAVLSLTVGCWNLWRCGFHVWVLGCSVDIKGYFLYWTSFYCTPIAWFSNYVYSPWPLRVVKQAHLHQGWSPACSSPFSDNCALSRVGTSFAKHILSHSTPLLYAEYMLPSRLDATWSSLAFVAPVSTLFVDQQKAFWRQIHEKLSDLLLSSLWRTNDLSWLVCTLECRGCILWCLPLLFEL